VGGRELAVHYRARLVERVSSEVGESITETAPASGAVRNVREARYAQPTVTIKIGTWQRKVQLLCVVRPRRTPPSDFRRLLGMGGADLKPTSTRLTTSHFDEFTIANSRPRLPPAGTSKLLLATNWQTTSVSGEDGVQYPHRCHGQVSSPPSACQSVIAYLLWASAVRAIRSLVWRAHLIPIVTCNNRTLLQVLLATTLRLSSSLPQ